MPQPPVRSIRVVETSPLTPHMVRVTFGGDDLAGLTARLAGLGPDQQVKLYFPRPGQTVPHLPPVTGADDASWYAAYTAVPEDERPWMRSYTIRAHDPVRVTVDIDFVLHGSALHGSALHTSALHGSALHGSALHDDAGPATRWARTARRGDVLAMYGPDGPYARSVPLTVPVADADWVLVAGDESALPGIGTLAEALPVGRRALAFVEVGGPADELPISSAGDLTVNWLHRGATPAGCSSALVDAVRGARFPEGRVFAWLGGEAGAVRALRRHLVDERGVHKRAIEFAGYWRHRRTQDDPPTEQDLADAQELLLKGQEPAVHAQERQERAPAVSDEA